MQSNIVKVSFLVLFAAGLAGCGSTTQDRALSGAGIGAAGGAVGGALIGEPLSGALLGGAIGGATGAFTDESDIDLGEPIWK